MTSDAVDKCTYRWIVLLLVVMSLTSFIIPRVLWYQEQKLQQQSPNSVTPKGDKSKMETISTKPPKVTTTCFTPAHFATSHVVYTNSYCTNTFNAALRGRSDQGVYEVLERNTPNPDGNQRLIKPLVEVLKPYFKVQSQMEERIEESRRLKTSVYKLVTYQTPVILLASAIVLLVPHVIWSLLSECCASFNVTQTLDSAAQASRSDASTRQQVYQDISASVSRSVRSSSKMAGTFYLVKKLLAVVVVVPLLLVVSQYALMEVDRLDKDLDTLTPVTVKSRDTTNRKSIVQLTQEEMILNLTQQFMCNMTVRTMINTQHQYTIQCTVMSVDFDEETAEASPWTSTSLVSNSDQERNLLEFSSILYKVVLSLLVILAVVNVVSLCSWLLKLLNASSKTRVGLTANAAMDTTFLLHMARINSGADVSYRLAQVLAGFDQIDQSEMTEK